MSPIPSDDRIVLSAQQIDEAALADWQVVDGRLHATFATRDFTTGAALVARIAEAADRADHHPDVDLRYTHVAVAMHSHDVAGLTARDVRLARDISSIATELGIAAAPPDTAS